MKQQDALWLYNETVARTIACDESATNQLMPFGGAIIGAGAPTVIHPNSHKEYQKDRFRAAQFLRQWADAIEGKVEDEK